MILATIGVFFRDMEYLWSVALMIIMYTCAIFRDLYDCQSAVSYKVHGSSAVGRIHCSLDLFSLFVYCEVRIISHFFLP